MARKKVLRIINRLNLGGPTYNASYLSKYISDDFETMLVAGMKDETEASSEYIPQRMGLKPVYIKEMYREISLSQDWKAFLKIKKIIEDYQPDIVHTHAAKSGTIGRLAAAWCNVPVVVHTFHGHVFHSYFNPIKTRLFLEIERYLASRTTRIIAISNKQKSELCDTYQICKPGKVEVIQLGFELDKFQNNQQEKRKSFRSRYNLDADEIAIGIIGRIVPIKNHELFVRGIARLKEQTSRKIRAFVVGDGEDAEKVKSIANQLGVDFVENGSVTKKATLTFTSWIKDIDVVNAGLDIVALTSDNEGTPVSLIEAQAANKPIVSTSVGGITDVVVPGETALLSAPGDIAAFSRNLEKLVSNDSLRTQLGRGGFYHVRQKFHYNRLVKETEGLYRALLANEEAPVVASMA